MIEAVINISEGRDRALLDRLRESAGSLLLDVHADPHHHRSVFTLCGAPDAVEEASLALSRTAVELLDLRGHDGVHPRLGVADVVPFVPYGSPFEAALAARDRFARQFGDKGVPCFLYGPERSLPEVRRQAFTVLPPDTGPPQPHPSAGATCVGARPVLVAYNLVVRAGLDEAREVARSLRRREVRALAFQVGLDVQISFNLIEPDEVGPAEVYDAVSELLPVVSAELVGLVPERVLRAVGRHRWRELGLSESATIESRLAEVPGG
ncbi:MAG TPA: hypothetical protein VKU92_12260 [Acidimicrobiales bacterium]|nr:hypothetical protein [Acidimicrobiales bacterium]